MQLGMSTGVVASRGGEVGRPMLYCDFRQNAGALLSFSEIIGSGLTYTGNNGAGGIIDEAGFLVQPTNNQPRFHHDRLDNNRPLGILLEEEGENKFPSSEDLGDSSWTKVKCSVDTDGVLSPDGTLNAHMVVEDVTTNERHYIHHSVTGNDEDTIYTIRAFVKTEGRDWIAVQNRTKGNQSRLTYFDTLLGAIGSGGNSPTLEDWGNGWYLVSMSINVATGGSSQFGGLRLAGADGDQFYDGDGSSGVRWWGVEFGKAPLGSYIRTTGVAKDRTKDVLTGDVSGALGVENTILLEGRTGYDNSSDNVAIQIDDGSTVDRYQIVWDSTGNLRVRTYEASILQADLDFGVYPERTDFKITARFAENDFAASLNGAAVLTDASGTIPGAAEGVNTIRFGSDVTGGEWNSTIRRAKVWDKGKPDGFLRAKSD